jgi:hypothetical protein
MNDLTVARASIGTWLNVTSYAEPSQILQACVRIAAITETMLNASFLLLFAF